jgi:mannose-6-phosphate isomerase-like protein (cupin superfamily)
MKTLRSVDVRGSMRFAAAFLIVVGLARGESHEVLKSIQIDKMLAHTRRSLAVQELPNYAVVLRVYAGKSGQREMNEGADEVWFVRQGNAKVSLGSQEYDVSGGDVVNVPRKTPYQIDPGTGRLEYVAVRIFPEGGDRPYRAQRMPDVLTKADIDATFVKFDSNQPLHSAKNFTVNYVIRKGQAGPWEAHRGCGDIYFIRVGTAQAQLGGQIANAKEDTPGEVRGTGVSGARDYSVGPGDIVLIPRNVAHHVGPPIGPASEKLGYLLVHVCAH